MLTREQVQEIVSMPGCASECEACPILLHDPNVSHCGVVQMLAQQLLGYMDQPLPCAPHVPCDMACNTCLRTAN